MAMTKTYDIDAGTIRRVDWLELVPLTLFFRAFSATFKPSFLLLGAFLVILTSCVITDGSNSRFASSWTEERVLAAGGRAIVNADGAARLGVVPIRYAFAPATRLLNVVSSNTPGSKTSLVAKARKSPVSFTIVQCVGFLLAAWLALAASRTAVVRLTSTSRSSTAASLKFATKRFPSALMTIVAPLCFLLAIETTRFIFSALGVVGDVLAPFAAFFFILFEAIFFILVLAAPLGLAAIAAENCDGFDAISRSVSYIVQRSLIGAIYAFVAQILIVVGSFVITFVTLPAFLFYANCFDMQTPGWVRFWGMALANIPVAYAYAAAIVYGSAIYVLLRRSVDGTPFDACALNLKGSAPRKLRKILKDGKGAPTFDAQQASMTEKKTETSAEERSEQEEKI